MFNHFSKKRPIFRGVAFTKKRNNKIKNIKNNTKTTRPNVLICELNKLCNILLYKIRIFDNLILSASTPITLKASLLILLINKFLLKDNQLTTYTCM